jgi:queuosine precursor transporter
MFILITVYALAMTLANLSIAHWGPWVSPINAFLFIGLDLALRDLLHTRLKAQQMGGLIVATGLLTYFLNPAAGMIAIASAVSFTAAAVIDWTVFAKSSGTWLQRSTKSNIAGAAVDSLVFPTLAFGVLMPQIVALQFVAKVAGGAIWGYLLNKLVKA